MQWSSSRVMCLCRGSGGDGVPLRASVAEEVFGADEVHTTHEVSAKTPPRPFPSPWTPPPPPPHLMG